MPSETTLIEAHSLCLARGERRVLHEVDVSVDRGEIVTLVGLNGAGKSTLVRVLLGLLPADRGSVWRRPKLRIGYSPQHVHRDPTLPMTVGRFLTLGSGRLPQKALEAALDEVGAKSILQHQIAGISGGELHRVLLARALLREPDLLVLDEPLAGVDVNGQSELYRLIGEIRDRHGCGVLLVSHDLYVVMGATDRVVCLDGHVCCTGRPETVATHPEFVSLFGNQVADSLALYIHHHDHEHSLGGRVKYLHDGHHDHG